VICIRSEVIKLGRIIIGYQGSLDFSELFLKTFSGNRTYTSRSYLYHFANGELVDEIIYGEIYKAKLRGLHNELIPDKLQYKSIQLNELYEYNRFCIFPDHTIAMCEKSKFTSDDFSKVFRKLFTRNCPDFAQIGLNYRRNDYDIFEIINGFDKMISVEVKHLKKSNPSPKPTFEKIENFLKKEQTDDFSAEFLSNSNSTDGLSRDMESHIMSAISLSDGGYGESKIVGLKEDARIVINTSDKIIQDTIEKTKHENSEGFISDIVRKFGKYINRSS